MNRDASLKNHLIMKNITPGGVSSPVRAFDPSPIYVDSGKGCRIKDIDGNEYVDLCMSYGPLILGHSHPSVIYAMERQMKKGSVFGAPSIPELELISEISKRVPCAEMVRLVNSGTEAVMHTIRLARGFTGKKGIIKMNGGFHGSSDPVLSDNSQTTLKKGITACTASDTYVAEYNSPEQIESMIEKNDIAAVLMEPVLGNVGVIPPEKDYLQKVRNITKKEGVLLIFDEVITGFRLAPGGAQEMYNVTPDLCTMGKIMGGGLPAGAFAGRKDIMSLLRPEGPVVQTGTFSGNPMTAAAGLAALKEMTNERYRQLNNATEELTHSMTDSLHDHDMTASVNRVGSMFQVFFKVDKVTNAPCAQKCNEKMYMDLFRRMLDSGIYMPPAALEANFTCTEHGRPEIQKIAEEFGKNLRCIA
ncbi:MAG: glutamate-1-semialdehyde 2,1-aminomutase [Methanomassiliicoccaceae archaeon]|jgi:glutamate-1-semialdehyde 2,1-aminomutase|nr:glutamate-1-semialdehyde 2,1-aminomutase [Methanomassiliicoccaceae archaeon]